MNQNALLAGGLPVQTLYSADGPTQQRLFQRFKEDFARSYTEAEEPNRFQAFVQSLKTIDARNALDSSATHGITRFSDLTQEEFAASFLTAKRSDAPASALRTVVDHVENTYNGTSSLVDWTGIFTTPVKDQGYCGSCWAFSATEQLESDSMRVLGTDYILSVEQTTQCTPFRVGEGCGGGWTEAAYDYIKDEGGLVQDEDYPYTKTTYEGKTGECTVNERLDVMTLTSYTQIRGESNMAAYVQSTGPLSVCVAAEVWNSYRGGIMTSCPGGVDHCVQAVGVDTSTKDGYWKVRNSWGSGWGEDGYIRLAYGDNTCMITDDSTWVVPKKA